MSESKNDVAWEKIFQKHLIIEKLRTSDHLFISSNDINKFREARLMTKFDHKSQLPKLFSTNNLSILPIYRGGYVIGEFETFCDFSHDDNIEIKRIPFPTFLESLNHQDITSEAIAINCAFVSDIIQDFTGECLLYPTVSGRMSSSSFNFNINSSNTNSIKNLYEVNVINSQIEIDGGYEGDNSLNLIEAKNYISDDFLVRQLFYPYKLWNQKINKRVRSIFLTYTNGVFHLREYGFADNNYYNSIQLVDQRKYAIRGGVINIEIIQQILNVSTILNEPAIPFPQADSFDRLINLCELLKEKSSLTKEEITQNYDFDTRQTDYYSNAGKYLELIDINRENDVVVCCLTTRGRNLFKLSIFDRQIEFVKLILSHAPFKSTLELYLKNSRVPTRQEIVEIMHNSNLWHVNSESTYNRRSSTIRSWIDWIIDLVDE
jgi:hypothetical protein